MSVVFSDLRPEYYLKLTKKFTRNKKPSQILPERVLSN